MKFLSLMIKPCGNPAAPSWKASKDLQDGYMRDVFKGLYMALMLQGMTLDYVKVSLGNIFAPGQAYVALSRARSLEGLEVSNVDFNCVKASLSPYSKLMCPESPTCERCHSRLELSLIRATSSQLLAQAPVAD